MIVCYYQIANTKKRLFTCTLGQLIVVHLNLMKAV